MGDSLGLVFLLFFFFFIVFASLAVSAFSYIVPILAIVLAIVLIVVLIPIALGILLYVFSSLAVYRLAKSCGFPNAWMAWLPIFNSYLLGGLADHYRAHEGKSHLNLRRWLTVTSVLSCMVPIIAGTISGISTVIGAIISALGTAISASTGMILLLIFLLPFLLMFISPILMLLFAMSMLAPLVCCAYPILTLIAAYHIVSKKNAVAFVILSIFFYGLYPLFLLCFVRKDAVPLSTAK